MGASRALDLGAEVHIFERRSGLGRKLLIAGSSGLNVSYEAPIEEFLEFYRSRNPEHFYRLVPIIRKFPAELWLEFLRSLGHEVFVGTSRRWFVREMKASKLLSSWTSHIEKKGGTFHADQEWIDLKLQPQHPPELSFRNTKTGSESRFSADAVILACGGGSWENSPPQWPQTLQSLGLLVAPFRASNVGYEIHFPAAFLSEAEGKPIKNCLLSTNRGKKRGELIVTRYGIEGTPVYFVGTPGDAILDLKPDLSSNEWFAQLSRPLRENLSPLRRLKKLGSLSEAALALVYHLTPEKERTQIHGDLEKLAHYTKNFPLTLLCPRPLEEAISSSGGLDWKELDENLMIHHAPGIFACGEMIHWDAPTGGFLIQASVALGYHAADTAFQWSSG